MEIMEHPLSHHVSLEEAAEVHVLQLLTGMVEMENKFQYLVHLKIMAVAVALEVIMVQMEQEVEETEETAVIVQT